MGIQTEIFHVLIAIITSLILFIVHKNSSILSYMIRRQKVVVNVLTLMVRKNTIFQEDEELSKHISKLIEMNGD